MAEGDLQPRRFCNAVIGLRHMCTPCRPLHPETRCSNMLEAGRIVRSPGAMSGRADTAGVRAIARWSR